MHRIKSALIEAEIEDFSKTEYGELEFQSVSYKMKRKKNEAG